ncbi:MULTISPECIES: hypothetical protein [Robiginitalea]|uniref:Cytochrome c domain-containing protein n=1 Tax=Robiginitalea biformata (strain ATCC BAA-864 / DSM 15991 / KCTC 12146 / HTCC2501) TaxID=313596 RepID=A4CNJ5_ROBBH|nr:MULTISPECIES: hypothetical protein [Robiginitalea]EAR14462.1 hypothetical protein RB2501_00261 [Robiginitalea biformata HTCC2501]MDC6355050.1 hypothetical protein [Robiginitalea sp. PM2]MDC6375317.1 hypothetical protein [Robiginitalea sp. SP8]
MKKMKVILGAVALAAVVSCSKGGDSDPVNDPPVNNPGNGSGDDSGDGSGDGAGTDPVSYQADIAPIMSSSCTNCHGDPPTQAAPMALVTLAQVRSAVEDRGLISRINSTSNPMPPDGRLPQATRDLIQAWVDQGFPE